MSILDSNNSIATSNNVHFFISKMTFLQDDNVNFWYY